MVRILSLDDDAPMLELINLILQRAGYEHLYTRDSYAALSILRNESIDLFTQDIMRPDIDGWEFYRLMKEETLLRDVPVLIVTCQAHSVDKARGIRLAPTDGYLTKPFGPQELLDAVAAMLKAHSKSPPTEEDRLRARRQREEAIRRRTQLIEEIIACLPNVRLQGQIVVIDGQRSRYEVALTTGRVMRSPHQPLCIVPDRKNAPPQMYLPFEEIDAHTEQIISTILMLSADYAINDQAILRQLKEQPYDYSGRSRN